MKNTVRAIRWICDCVSLYSNLGYAYFPFWCLLRHVAGKIAFSCLFTHQHTPQKAKVCVWLFKTLLLLWTRLVPLEKHSPRPHPPLEKTSELFMQKSVCVVGRVGGGVQCHRQTLLKCIGCSFTFTLFLIKMLTNDVKCFAKGPGGSVAEVPFLPN